MKEKIITSVMVLLGIVTTSKAQNALSIYFSPYLEEETGMMGLKFGDELCLAPQYEEIAFNLEEPYYYSEPNPYYGESPYDTSAGLFAYREGEKWGLTSIYGKVFEPKFDRIRIPTQYNILIVKEGDKEMVADISGNILSEVGYDSITSPLNMESYGAYFMAFNEGNPVIINALGDVILNKLDSGRLSRTNYKSNDKLMSDIKKVIKKTEKGGKRPYSELSKQLKNQRPAYGMPAVFGHTAKEIEVFNSLEGEKFLLFNSRLFRLDPSYEYKVTPGIHPQNDLPNPYFIFGQNGKWGVLSFNGDIILPMEYDEISQYGSYKFKVMADGKWGVVNNMGQPEIPVKYQSLESWSNDDGCVLFIGQIDKQKEYYNGLGDYPHTYFGDSFGKAKKQQKYEADNKSFKAAAEPYVKEVKRQFSKQSSFTLAGKPYKEGDVTGFITDNGLDLGPLAYSTPKERLKRNPSSIVALAMNIWDGKNNTHRGRTELKDLIGLCALAEEIGYRNSDFVNQYSEEIDRMEAFVTRQEESMERERRNREFNERIDRISAALTGALNAGIAAYSAVTSPGNGSGYDGDVTSATAKKTGKLSQNINSLSDNQAYNTDKKSYNNYDSMISAVRAGNRKANPTEVKKWMQSMKQLRQKWEAKGKSFPHSPNEDYLDW